MQILCFVKRGLKGLLSSTLSNTKIFKESLQLLELNANYSMPENAIIERPSQ